MSLLHCEDLFTYHLHFLDLLGNYKSIRSAEIISDDVNNIGRQRDDRKAADKTALRSCMRCVEFVTMLTRMLVFSARTRLALEFLADAI